MSFEKIIIKANDGYELDCKLYDHENPKAVVKFIHGMEEHQDRYIPFAERLQQEGYAVLTANLRGHGPNAPLLSHIADKNGHKLLIEDEQVFIKYLKEHYPDKPIYLFGHSMGTIIARTLLQTNSKDFTKVALSGYPNPQGVASVGVFLSNFIGLFKKKTGHSKLINNMVIGGFAKAVPNAKTPIDWLSYNEDNVKRYAEDEYCGVEFTIGSYNALFHIVAAINKPKLYKDVNNELPILLISGEEDPCTSGEKGRKDSLDRLTKAGFKNIEVVTLEHMRHEILNENDKEVTYKAIIDFLNK